MYKILIVEDDNTIAERLASHLKKWNYKTVCVRDFKNVMEEFKKTDPQLVILDIGLPFYNGFYWCQEIRKLSNVPIIFLSSMNDNMNIVMAMNMGGDEFIEKPFDLNVVTAKVQAVLRRACGSDIRICDDELAEALKHLSERNRENLLMYYFLEMSDTEIAKRQNISRSGVFQNRHNSLELMKKILKEK